MRSTKFLSLVQLLVSSTLLFIYFVIPCFTEAHFANFQFVFFFGVDHTLLDCQFLGDPKLEEATCFTNEKALEFLQWSRTQAFTGSRIKSRFIALTDGVDTTKKFNLATSKYKQDRSVLHHISNLWSKEQEYNLTNFFSIPGDTVPQIIEGGMALEKNYVMFDYVKDLMALHNDFTLTNGAKFIFLFDNGPWEYLYNNCYKQYYKQGLWMIKVKAFEAPTAVAAPKEQPRSSYGLDFSEILAKFKDLFARTPGNYMLEHSDLIDLFASPRGAVCGYDMKAPDRLHFALAIDVNALSSFTDALVTSYFTEFLEAFSKLPISSKDNRLALVVLCNWEDFPEFCHRCEKLLIGVRQWNKHIASVNAVLSSGFLGVDNSARIGVATNLPQRTTVVVQVDGMVHSDSVDAPNICYLRSTPADFSFLKNGPAAVSQMQTTKKKTKHPEGTALDVPHKIGIKEVMRKAIEKPPAGKGREKKTNKVENAPLDPAHGSPLGPLKSTYDAIAKLLVEAMPGLSEFGPADIAKVMDHLQTKFGDSRMFCKKMPNL